jgi:hypothetical protein
VGRYSLVGLTPCARPFTTGKDSLANTRTMEKKPAER